MAFGAIAQLVARFHGMEEVAGSIPASSTTRTLILIQKRECEQNPSVPSFTR